MATAGLSTQVSSDSRIRTISIEPHGDGLDDIRESLRHDNCDFFAASDLVRVLDRLDEAEMRLRSFMRPEAVGYRTLSGTPHVVLRCRACKNEFVGPTQASWLTPPPARSE